MNNAGMVELVDTRDLKSLAYERPGSSPGVRTIVHYIGKSNDLELQNYATVLSGVT